jgi:hypothetical protein
LKKVSLVASKTAPTTTPAEISAPIVESK